MKSKVLVVLILFLAATIGIYSIFMNKKDDKKDEPYNPNDVEISEFDYAFLKLETNKENLIYSPLSIKYALFMLSDGASENTKKEIDDLIGDKLPTKYKNIDKVLSLANSIFIIDTYKEYVLDEYINTLKDKYDAEVIYDKFKNANNVNKWIEEKTFKIIKNMLEDSDVQNETLKMILINALAIDMEWDVEFDDNNTGSSQFIKENKDKIKVAMMHKSSTYNEYYKDDDYTILSLPLKKYEDTELEFIAVMPDKDLHKFITSDDFEKNLESVLNKIHKPDEEELSISIPRFEFNYNLKLKEDLMNLGIKDAFSIKNANFSNMSKEELYVGDAKHKADIKFSEKGIKAAAVTVIMMLEKSAFEEPKEIVELNFNKPFMFIIRDKNTKDVWFTGTVYEPVLWDEVKDDYKQR